MANNENMGDQFLTDYRPVQSIFHLTHSCRRASAKFSRFGFVSRSREWGTGRSFGLNRANIRRIIQPLHVVALRARGDCKRERIMSGAMGDGRWLRTNRFSSTRNEIVWAQESGGASITAFDIIIAGGDLGASRLIDYNAPHIL